jgi:hypothetical protein
MNKHEIDSLLPDAYIAILEGGFLSKDGKIDPAFRSQISSYGAAVANGSLLAATACFSHKGNADVDRSLLINAINVLMCGHFVQDDEKKKGSLFDTLVALNPDHGDENTKRYLQNIIKEQVMMCAVALKLAFNLFILESKKGADETTPAAQNGQG